MLLLGIGLGLGLGSDKRVRMVSNCLSRPAIKNGLKKSRDSRV